MLILGIETSCDDTAAALVEAKAGRFRVIKNMIISQAKLHNKYGGVVPELAARNHLKNIIPAIQEALGNTRPSEIDAIAVTAGPGLATSL
ncbi:MAG: tRNA (adenosine(37)-N6)-threonylcarbamoyltransferase complex transferase subunit TsaD, partial [Patescibacteria group bacterium]|nr:tRNA (adenosine(37)-N6)-threonylcarbamoyltransferase complex transferase subunit TsaD [Patescibacteria group bacterium]